MFHGLRLSVLKAITTAEPTAPIASANHCGIRRCRWRDAGRAPLAREPVSLAGIEQ